jgi:RimJ/RimL family protein N-acetyltransferase
MTSAPPTPVLRGEHVTLRPYSAGFSDDDLWTLYSWARDDEVLALAGGLPLTLDFDRFKALFLTQLPRHNSALEQLFVILDAEGELVGRAGLYRIDPPLGRAELGIVIGERDRWAQGLGRDTVRTLVRYGVEQLGLTRIVLFTYPDNLRAQRAFASAGFRALRTVRRFSLEMGAHDVVEMVWEGGG